MEQGNGIIFLIIGLLILTYGIIVGLKMSPNDFQESVVVTYSSTVVFNTDPLNFTFYCYSEDEWDKICFFETQLLYSYYNDLFYSSYRNDVEFKTLNLPIYSIDSQKLISSLKENDFSDNKFFYCKPVQIDGLKYDIYSDGFKQSKEIYFETDIMDEFDFSCINSGGILNCSSKHFTLSYDKSNPNSYGWNTLDCSYSDYIKDYIIDGVYDTNYGN